MLPFIEKHLLSGQNRWHHTSRILMPRNNIRSRSVILIHGFIGSPFDMKPLGRHLLKKGFKVVIPVLPGQTSKTSVFRRHRYSAEFYLDWLRSIIEEETQAMGKKPFLAGFSMGGALSTVMAAQGLVEKLVLIAPFYKLTGISDKVWQVSGKLAPVIPFVPKLSKGKINSNTGYRLYQPGSMFVSLRAFNVLGDLALEARGAARDIRVQTLVIVSREDRVADTKMTIKLFKGLQNVDFFYENRADHIMLHDHGAQQIVKKISVFFLS